ncbi:MAG: hypothetical protein R3F35_14400 [Myxococcota bacterium]
MCGGLVAAVSTWLLVGCTPVPGELEPLPRHPFPRWVEQLEVGSSDAEIVRARFGEPHAVEQSVTGGAIHRYRFAEIHWPDDDPDRPVVGARGHLEPRPRTKREDIGASIAAFGRWLDWLMFYPPRQPRPAAPRYLPATIHHLEVRFDLEGRLVAYAYRSEPGRAPATRPG